MKRVLVGTERDMQQFTAAMDAVNVDIDDVSQMKEDALTHPEFSPGCH